MTAHDSPPRSRVDSFGLVTLAYLVALAAGLWVLSFSDGSRPLLALFAADVVATLVIFAFSIQLDNGSTYDPYWSVVPPLFALYWLGFGEDAVGTRQVVVTTLVFVWAIRLTWNWARGWPGLHHEDWRYEMLYSETPLPKWVVSLLGIHVFPTIQVFLGCLAFVPALALGREALGLLDAIALVVTGGAILLETVADAQMRAFARTKEPGDIMDQGLWGWCRHPNYLGELGFWWGLWLFAIAAADGWWWTVIGPLAMTAMFHWASIPMLDRRSVERRPGYAEHMGRANALIPSPPHR
jgi:steroid 5-alpha reductase family enzyme